jgi:1-deoxy-D-xylulose-5-phosphate reductoisomerase
MMLNSVVGMVGLLPTLSAVEKKIPVALANKETLVAGGNIVMKLAKEKNTPIIPVDSEHSAIFQCLQGNERKDLNKIILTASGGPFYGKKKHELENVTVKDALNHPNWNMGNKITIDSATLMNKGLEFIEAKWLFDLEPSQIEVVVHRQSILHSAVEYKDFSIIAQLGMPDMKIPIQYALLYPKRLPSPAKRLSLTECGTLTFEKPDYETFECLSACILAIKKDGIYPCVVNAANEVAVEQFLNGKISFLKISELVIKTMEKFPYSEPNSYSDIENADKAAREYAISLI